MPRAQNAHAFVNAGFLVRLVQNKVVSSRICFGGINPKFIHATATENFLVNKELFTNETLKEAFNILNNEIIPDWILPDASPEYRKNLALSLFYKFILNSCPKDKIKPEHLSGGEILKRPLSSGIQTYNTYEKEWPLTKPVHKYEGLIQCSGEAQFVNDIPHQNGQLWAAFIPATKPHLKIGKIDGSEALVSNFQVLKKY